MNNTDSKKAISVKKIFLYAILIGVLGSGICYTFYRLNRAQKVKQAVQMYQGFLEGERKVGKIDIYYLITPTNEPDRRYRTRYTLVDSNGDGIPELHIRTGREYTIYSCKDNEMYEFEAFFSSPGRYVPLKSGSFIYRNDIGITLGDFYYYFEMDASGNCINEIKFSWLDANQNLLCDDDDEFVFDGDSCTKEEWFAKTRKYLFTDEDGREQIRNQAEWTVYCEEIW